MVYFLRSFNVLIYPPHVRFLLSLEGPFTNTSSSPPPTPSGRAWPGLCGRPGGEGCSLCQVLLALCISWLLCFVLTVTSTFPSAPTAYGYLARTDTKGSVLSQAPWFRFPYPGNEKMQTLLAWDMYFPGLPMGLEVGFSSKESGNEGQALGSPYQTPERRRRPLGRPMDPCVCVWGGVGSARPEVPTPRTTSKLAYTPQHPFTLLRAHEYKSGERTEGSQPSSQNFGSPPRFGGSHARET